MGHTWTGGIVHGATLPGGWTIGRPGRGTHVRCRAWVAHAAGAYALLAAVSVLLVWLYVSAERCVYYWDSVNYQNRAFFLTDLALRRPLSAAAAVLRSLGQDYSYLPCVPLVPFLAVFGQSRLTYVAALALAYLTPFCVVCGAIALRVIGHPRRTIFRLAALTALLTPTACAATLRGYPDLGAATLTGLAFLLHFRDPPLRRPRTCCMTAALLALAALFRRPSVFSGAAYVGAALTETMVAAVRGVLARRPGTLAKAARRGWALARVCILFALLASPLAVTALGAGYGELYRSYRQGIGTTLVFFGQSCGWLPVALSAAGLAWAGCRPAMAGMRARRMVLFTCAFLVLWTVGARYTGIHYATHLVIPLVTGLSAATALVWRTRNWGVRLGGAGALAAVAAVNAFAGLTPQGTGPLLLRPMLASANPPLVRNDLPELARLVAFLRDSAAAEPIYVAASSETLNESILREAERQQYGRAGGLLRVLSGSEVDSRDPSPLAGLAVARWVIIAEPFQHVLRAEEQDVVRYVVDSFSEGWGAATDFARVPAAFVLQGGVRITVFRRTRPASPETLRSAADSLALRVDALPRPAVSGRREAVGPRLGGTALEREGRMQRRPAK